MSGKTVTDRRIAGEIKKLDKSLCTLYEGYFPGGPADEQVWKDLDQAEDLLAERLKPRPLGLMEIRRACSSYTAHFKRACNSGRQRAGDTTQAHGSGAG